MADRPTSRKMPKWLENTLGALILVVGIAWCSNHFAPTSSTSNTVPSAAPVRHAAAAAQPAVPDAYKKAEAEARTFLATCKVNASQQDCLQSQRTFVELYVHAMAGSFLGAVTVAGMFDPLPAPDRATALLYLGVQRNVVQACAWWTLLSLTTALSDRNADYVQTAQRHCAPLSPANREAAQRRLHEIGQSLNFNAEPPADWHPIIAGLRAD